MWQGVTLVANPQTKGLPDMQIRTSEETDSKCSNVHKTYPPSSNFDQRVYLVIALFSALLNSHLAFLDIFTSIGFSFAMPTVHNVILVFNLQGFKMYFAVLKDCISHGLLNCVDVN